MARFRRLRPSPSMLAALAVCAVGLGGTAVAATLITSKQIKDGTIQLKDISRSARAQLQGDDGAPGAAGAVGPAGSAGATGAAGAQGETGPQGPQGAKGDTGLTGPTGPSNAYNKRTTANGFVELDDPDCSSGPCIVISTKILALDLPAGSYVINAKVRLYQQSGSTADSGQVNCGIPHGAGDQAIAMLARPGQAGGVTKATVPLQTVIELTNPTRVTVVCMEPDVTGAEVEAGGHLTAIKVGSLTSAEQTFPIPD